MFIFLLFSETSISGLSGKRTATTAELLAERALEGEGKPKSGGESLKLEVQRNN
jgi:hypothetical protein